MFLSKILLMALMLSIVSPLAPVAVVKSTIAVVRRWASLVENPKASDRRKAPATSSCLNGDSMAKR